MSDGLRTAFIRRHRFIVDEVWLCICINNNFPRDTHSRAYFYRIPCLNLFLLTRTTSIPISVNITHMPPASHMRQVASLDYIPFHQVFRRWYALDSYMILHAPTDVGRGNISNEVMSCPNEKHLADMAKLYIQIFLRCCEDLSPLRLHTFLICSLLFCPQSSLQKVLLLYPPAILLGPRSMMLQILSYISSLRLLKTTETRKHSLV